MAQTDAIAAKAALRDLIERYFFALDMRDWQAFRSCFADAAAVTFHAGSTGAVELSSAADVTTYIAARIESYTRTIHAVANSQVELTGGAAATGVTHAIAYVVIGERVLVRGIRYTDTFVHDDSGWRIAQRAHAPMWQFEAAAAVPSINHHRR